MVAEDLKNKLVFLDTAPLIYFIEGNSAYQQILKKLFTFNDEGYFKFLTSTVTLLEVLVKPLRDGETNVADKYTSILTNAEGIDIFDITSVIAARAASLRAIYNLRTPDALQVATAIQHNADYFFTNDLRLQAIADIKVITIEDLID